MKVQKGTVTHQLETQLLTVIDLKNLEGVEVNHRLYLRGQELRRKNRVHRNSTYPWRFVVSGDRTPKGSTLYFVDLASFECSCMWFINTKKICKHQVAALIVHAEETA